MRLAEPQQSVMLASIVRTPQNTPRLVLMANGP